MNSISASLSLSLNNALRKYCLKIFSRLRRIGLLKTDKYPAVHREKFDTKKIASHNFPEINAGKNATAAQFHPDDLLVPERVARKSITEN